MVENIKLAENCKMTTPSLVQMLHYLFCDFCIENIKISELSCSNSPGVKRFPGQFCQIYHILSLLKFDPSVTFLPFKIRQIPNIFPSLAQINSQAWTQPLLFAVTIFTGDTEPGVKLIEGPESWVNIHLCQTER